MDTKKHDLAKMIDHTLLKPSATQADLTQLCAEAKEYGFFSVCVNSKHIAFCVNELEGTDVKTVAVVGFPLGAMHHEAKAFETRLAIRHGANEIDMVIDIGALKERRLGDVSQDIRAVVDAAGCVPVKVILETSMLDASEKVAACHLARQAGAAFVKTSTGFGGGGATVEDIRLMRSIVGTQMGVKASGGVRSSEDADAVIAAGANRIGASAGIAIVSGSQTSKDGY